MTTKDELLFTIALFFDILQEISLDAPRRRIVVATLPAGVAEMIAQSGQEQCECGQALLSVDQQPARKPRQGVTGGNINNRAEEVAGFSARAGSAKYVTPKLGTLRLSHLHIRGDVESVSPTLALRPLLIRCRIASANRSVSTSLARPHP